MISKLPIFFGVWACLMRVFFIDVGLWPYVSATTAALLLAGAYGRTLAAMEAAKSAPPPQQ